MTGTIWHCLTDGTEDNTYDVFIRSADRPTNKQIRLAIHLDNAGDHSEYLAAELEALDIMAYKIDDNIIDIEELER